MTRLEMTKLGALYLASAISGLLADLIGLPLPWMIGPILSTMALCLSGAIDIRVPTVTRPFGQVVVATFVGAHFTQHALHALVENWHILLGASLFTILISALIAQLQSRIYGTEPVASFLSVAPTSPIEASILAESNNVPGPPVAMAQTVRIILVVTTIPILLKLLGEVSPTPEAAPGTRDLTGLAMTIAGSTAGFMLFRLMRLSNPFFLGPLLIIAVMSCAGLPVFDFPQPVMALAQIILGTWLGGSFRRELLTGGQRLIQATFMSSALLLLSCLLAGLALSLVVDLPASTLILGFAPGGVTEMALTAGILGQDVAVVTAMHLARIFMIMPNLTWMVHLGRRLSRHGDPDT